jgi:tetratricopeptide (TPR) repeat protein
VVAGILLVIASTAACAFAPRPVRALDGRQLPPLPMDALRIAELEHATEQARHELALHPDDEDAYIWLGRRLAYEGAYHEAIDVFTEGLERFPDSSRLLRHRGHRFITVRDFEAAVRDLKRAKQLAFGHPDSIEPDGAPNAAGIPRSTRRGNIQYHLGLAYYLLGRFEKACVEYRLGLELSRNDDTLVSTGWWLYLASRRSLNREFADGIDILQSIQPEMDILENEAYHRLLLMARGDLQPQDVVPEDLDSIQGATLGYGVAAFLALQGDPTDSIRLKKRVLQSPWWSAFGSIAAESDMWRATRSLEAGAGPATIHP